MFNPSKLIPKVGDYAIAPSGAVTDLTLMDVATQYETQVSRKMIALIPEQIPKRFTGSEGHQVLATIKVDGEGVFVYFERDGDHETLFAFNAPSGRVRVGLPALQALQIHLQASSVQKALFRAELYLPKQENQRRPGIAAVLRTSFNGTAAEIANLRFLMLDVIMLDGKDLRAHQSQFQLTWQLLGDLFGSDAEAAFHRPQGSLLLESELPDFFERMVQAGEEGIVVRRLNRTEVCKIKPRLSLDAAIIGFVEGEYEGQYGVTSILIAMTYPYREEPITFQTLLRVGSGMTDDQRAEFLRLFSPLVVESPITITDPEGRPVSFIRPDYIVEINAEDLSPTVPGSDRPNRTQVLEWNSQTDSYRFLGLHPCPRPSFATFLRLRPDKQLSEGGARLEQIVLNPEKPTFEAIQTQEPRTLRREIFTKGDMLRKLVLLQTTGEDRIPYLVYWTDFSPNRKDPLKCEVAYAFTEARAQQLANRFIAENVVRGWVPYGESSLEKVPSAKSTKSRSKKTDPDPDTSSKPSRSRSKKSAPELDPNDPNHSSETLPKGKLSQSRSKKSPHSGSENETESLPRPENL